MLRVACAAALVSISGCTLYFGSPNQSGAADGGPAPEPTGERLDRECLTGVVAGDLVAVNHDELFITWGCHGMTGETLSWGPTLASLFGTGFPFEFEPLRVQDAWAQVIQNDHRTLLQFGTGFPHTSFEHTINDLVRVDVDGNGTREYVTSGDGIVRRGPVPAQQYDGVAATTETTLLTTKQYRYIAVTNLSGSTLPDIFYTTTAGELGLATQTSPDQFTEQSLGNGTSPQRLHTADVDGDGLDDVIGASPFVFVYSTRKHALVQLADRARAISAGDVDGDGVDEPVFLTENGLQVRRVVGLTTAGAPTSQVVLNTTEAQALTLASMDGDPRSDIALIHEAGQATSWLELRRATSFAF